MKSKKPTKRNELIPETRNRNKQNQTKIGMNNTRKKHTTKKYKLLLLLSCQKQSSKLSVAAVVENIAVIRVVMWREKGVIESKTLK